MEGPIVNSIETFLNISKITLKNFSKVARQGSQELRIAEASIKEHSSFNNAPSKNILNS